MPDTTLIVEVLQIGLGFVFLSLFGNPKPTRDFRIRFRIAVIILPLIAVLGLRPLAQAGAGREWVRHASVFQCFLNVAVTILLCVRYRLYMPPSAGDRV